MLKGMKLVFLFFVLWGGLSDAQGQVPPYRAVQNDPMGEVSTISMERARVLFTRFQRETSIPYNYPMDGCYARATAMARIAQKQGLTMGKVFTHGMLQVRTGNPGYPLVQWGYHVAPIIEVRQADGSVKKMVFDPSLFDRPVTVDEWNQRMLDQVPASEGGFTPRIERTYFTSRFQHFPNQRDAGYWSRDTLNNVHYTFERYRPLERRPPVAKPAASSAAEEGVH